MTGHLPISDTARARLAEIANRELSVQEWRAQAAIPISQEEIEHTLSLVRWYRRRYPTAASRLAYARRSHRRWQRATAPGRPSE